MRVSESKVCAYVYHRLCGVTQCKFICEVGGNCHSSCESVEDNALPVLYPADREAEAEGAKFTQTITFQRNCPRPYG